VKDLGAHISALLDEHSFWLSSPPKDLPDFCRGLFTEQAMEKKRLAALHIEEEILRALMILRDRGGSLQDTLLRRMLNMPKPDNPGSQGKGKGKGNTIQHFLDHGWNKATVTSGQQSVAVAFDPVANDMQIMGKLFDADGDSMKGKKKFRAHFEETDSGVLVTLSSPADQDIFVLYKLESDEDDEDIEIPSAAI
jgi:hypothetical protein